VPAGESLARFPSRGGSARATGKGGGGASEQMERKGEKDGGEREEKRMRPCFPASGVARVSGEVRRLSR